MIDWTKSAERNGYSVDELKSRFVRFPKSEKRIVAVCDLCGYERDVYFSAYHELCHHCACHTPDAIELHRQLANKQFSDPAAREAARLKSIEQFSTQESRDAASARSTQYHEDHPEAAESARLRGIERFSTQESRDEMSEIMNNSAVHKVGVENQIGGNDIVGHHMIYDHSDLSKNKINITRSVHMRLHRLFQKHDITIPHINIGANNGGV